MRAKINSLLKSTKILFAATAIAVCLAGCSIVPKGSAVLSDTYIGECKLKDVSDQYDGRYLRITAKDGRGGEKGGRQSHRHSYAHKHNDRLNETPNTQKPLGTDERASSSAHMHLLKADRQTPTLTNKSPNEVSHIRWSLFEANGSRCLPAGTIVGYIGLDVPDGWSEVNGIKDVYIRISTDDLNTIVSIDTNHSHNYRHEHRFTTYKPKPNEGNSVRSFRPGQQSEVVPVVHGHQIGSSTFEGSDVSGATEPLLSYFKLRFLRLNEKTSSIPRGVTILYTGKGEPSGWLRLDQAATDPIDGTFLMVAEAGTKREVVHHHTTHIHTMNHGHSVITETPTDSDTRRFNTGSNLPMATTSHAHEATLDIELTGEQSEHLPEYVEVHLLMKK